MASSPAPSPPKSNGSRPESPLDGEGHQLTIRALVTTKDAGIIIGKGGANVAEIRAVTGVKAGVSKVVPGVHERVLSVSGSVEGVAHAFQMIIKQLLSATPSSPSIPVTPPSTHTSIRLLISHNLMGTVIGRSGLKIKAIQDASGARMVASKDMLPQSTERVVEVQGTAEGIGKAVEEIGRCLLEDWDRGVGTVLYHPTPEHQDRGGPGSRRNTYTGGSGSRRGTIDEGRRGSVGGLAGSPPPPDAAQTANFRTQNISIPSDMVGCIIGRSGTKITEIRRLSGSKISIAKAPHDETGERMFTIVGTPEANEKALFLLYNQLEMEKKRRVGREEHEEQ
ncbi:RNA binding protein, heterogenous nuclear RNP-K like protein [Tulasnella sp. 419]|nr:RNA binding protein, heterogenous nuclear RNP-K like protein [Tulasnella sp. 418]KAG8961569.1 RNA binding protein, heterogenous nuclear RNP-K like protein [Tulasnella sp. 419]